MEHFGAILIAYILLFSINTSDSDLSDTKKIKTDSRKGILISPQKLRDISYMAKSGIEPYNSNVEIFLTYIDSLMNASMEWPKLSGEIVIPGGSSSIPIQLSSEGGKLAYGTAIAWHLTNNSKYANRAKELILDLTDTYGYRDKDQKEFQWGAQGILNLARGATPYIYSASLLEGYQGWKKTDKLTYQIWLRDIMYPKVSWASRTRKNNWGVAGSFSAALIAYYLMDQPEWKLKEISPVYLELSPKEAYDSHNMYQLGRQSTSKYWKMDSKASLWGILSSVAIPEEIRRGADPVDGDHLESNGSGTDYTMTYIEHLTAHAQFLMLQGDSTLYNNAASDGSGSLLQAYLFVINNPVKSHCFTPDRINALYFAYQYYKHPALLRSLKECGSGNISGHRLALYGRLTYPISIIDD